MHLKLVSDIYSPPGVTKMLAHMSNRSLVPGLAFELATLDPYDGMRWDLSLREKQTKVLKHMRRAALLFVIGPLHARDSARGST